MYHQPHYSTPISQLQHPKVDNAAILTTEHSEQPFLNAMWSVTRDLDHSNQTRLPSIHQVLAAQNVVLPNHDAVRRASVESVFSADSAYHSSSPTPAPSPMLDHDDQYEQYESVANRRLMMVVRHVNPTGTFQPVPRKTSGRVSKPRGPKQRRSAKGMMAGLDEIEKKDREKHSREEQAIILSKFQSTLREANPRVAEFWSKLKKNNIRDDFEAYYDLEALENNKTDVSGSALDYIHHANVLINNLVDRLKEHGDKEYIAMVRGAMVRIGCPDFQFGSFSMAEPARDTIVRLMPTIERKVQESKLKAKK